ncbi:hypothetical protein BRSPCE3_43860 [Bradyrhizobium sp. Ce-3]|nr:hypothetical protein BRSPCE3_43860 [Bradyrhizobium sp. Ce-3]
MTPRFFAVSSYKGDKVWYNRCNFSGRLVHCVLINYPAEEERAWDEVVTRVSLSLSGSRSRRRVYRTTGTAGPRSERAEIVRNPVNETEDHGSCLARLYGLNRWDNS